MEYEKKMSDKINENTKINDREIVEKIKEKTEIKTKKKNKKNKGVDIENIKNIEEKKSAFSSLVSQYKKDTKSKTQVFLFSIKDDIEKAIENEMSYVELSKKIQEVFGIQISSTTISSFYKKNNIGKKEIVAPAPEKKIEDRKSFFRKK